MGAAGGMIGSMAGQGGGMMGGMIGSIASYAYFKRVVKPMLKKIGEQEAEEIRRTGRKIGAMQVVSYAKAGVRTNVGTPLAVASETAARTELDALKTLFSYKYQIYEMGQQAKFRMATSIMMMGGQLASSASQLNWSRTGGTTNPLYEAGALGAAGAGQRAFGGGMSNPPKL